MAAIMMAIVHVRDADGEEKQRLQFKVLMRDTGTADLFTRASQGHSRTLKAPWSLHKYIVLHDNPAGRSAPYPDVAIHGARWAAFEGIMWVGLSWRKEHNTKKKGTGRSHIHVVPTLQRRDVQSGWDPESEITISIYWHQALKDKIEFCWSDNGALLSEGVNGIIEPYYINYVEEIATGKQWRNPHYLGSR
eukprot:4412495-Pyramimonas_sp.AAC.1